MAFQTKVFGLFYKHFPSTSYDDSGPLLNEDAFDTFANQGVAWYLSGSSTTPKESGSWFNYPKDTITNTYRNTRTAEAFITASYRALPWGSHAADFMWNIMVPSWSWITGGTGYTNLAEVGSYKWAVTYSSNSFHQQASSTKNVGVSSYSITSSWVVFDPKMTLPDSTINNPGYNFGIRRYLIAGSYINNYALEAEPYTTWPTNVGRIYESSSYRLGSDATRETSSIDGQYFDQGSGAAITRTEVSRSLVTASLFASSTSNPGLNNFRRGLKNRRLFFPTPYSGSGTLGATDYWLKSFTGFSANEVFTENGGIYAVDFTLKRHIPSDNYPDTGTFMSVFIHDVMSQAPTPTQRTAGAGGWYPPANNIVTIGNGYGSTPVMSFVDQSTGYLHEKFSILLVQYGYPAQLCFEASGSLANDAYFGIIVDDVSFCKLGVTTDPNFIKPETNGGYFNPTAIRDTLNPAGDLVTE